MINISTTNKFGQEGFEQNFYVDSELTDKKLFIGRVTALEVFACKWINNPMPIIRHIDYANIVLDGIFRNIPKRDSIIPDGSMAHQYVGTQSFVHVIYKLFTLFMFEAEKIYVLKNTPEKYERISSVTQLLKEEKYSFLASILFKRESSRELFSIVHDLEKIYLSNNGPVTMNIIGDGIPVISGVYANSSYGKYIYHNHSIVQIVAGINIFLKDINFFPENV